MATLRRTFRSALLALVFSLLSTSVLWSTPLADATVVIVVRTGTNADGTERLEVADSGDARAAELWNYAQTNQSMQSMLAYYRSTQQSGTGTLSAEDRELLSFYGGASDPIYFELEEGSGGAYCDWKAKFSVEMPTGQTVSVETPKVVVRRNDPVFTGGDEALKVQTMVHEMGHAAMSKLYDYDDLPYTEWLHKEHAGGMVTDEKLALIEGWAEFIGAHFTGRYTIANDPANALRDNRYVYADIYTRTTLRSAADLYKTEGWVATALLELVESGTISMDELSAVMREYESETFKGLVNGLEATYPDRKAAIRSILAEASKGQLYPEYRTLQSSLFESTSSAASDGMSLFTSSLTGATTGDSSGKSKLLAGLIGAAIGALAGGPFGVVGIAIGGTVGFFVGQLIANYASDSAARSPLDTSASAGPALVGPSEPSLESEVATTLGSPDITALRGRVNDAFVAYIDAVRSGTQAEQQEALATYRGLKTSFTKALETAR